MINYSYVGSVTQLAGDSVSFAYTVDVTNRTATPTSSNVVAYQIDDGSFTDVSSTILSGAASESGAVITTPAVAAITKGQKYRIVVTYITDGASQRDGVYFILEAV